MLGQALVTLSRIFPASFAVMFLALIAVSLIFVVLKILGVIFNAIPFL